jgi:hypothetical protein
MVGDDADLILMALMSPALGLHVLNASLVDSGKFSPTMKVGGVGERGGGRGLQGTEDAPGGGVSTARARTPASGPHCDTFLIPTCPRARTQPTFPQIMSVERLHKRWVQLGLDINGGGAASEQVRAQRLAARSAHARPPP